MSDATKPEGPSAEELKRWRPFRGLAWALYLTFAVSFSSLIIFSVFKSVLAMTPGKPELAGSALSEQECFADARSLFVDLEDHRKALGAAKKIAQSDQEFLSFRVDWLKKKRALEVRCNLDSRDELSKAMDALDRVMDLYTTASVQFSGGVGPAADDAKKLLSVK
ncbi:MAG: hypothetical protein QM817_11615 [Archangium sp.]